ncbi:unnamed protein product [Calypogeia fissa]
MQSTRYPKQGHISAVPLKECKLTNKYENIKSTINSGLSVLRVTDKFAETKANARFKKEELFRRMKPGLLTKLVEESEVQVLLLDLRDIDDYQICHIKGALSYPAVNLKKSVNYFSADILSFINKEPERIIVIYDDDEYVMASAGNLFFEKGVDNIFVLHGGLKEVASRYSYMVEGEYPKPLAPLRPICNTSIGRTSVSSSKSSTPNWIKKNKELCSGLSTPANTGDKPAKPRPGWGFPRSGPMSVSYSDTSSS